MCISQVASMDFGNVTDRHEHSQGDIRYTEYKAGTVYEGTVPQIIINK